LNNSSGSRSSHRDSAGKKWQECKMQKCSSSNKTKKANRLTGQPQTMKATSRRISHLCYDLLCVLLTAKRGLLR
jgi:hypothetical protein